MAYTCDCTNQTYCKYSSCDSQLFEAVSPLSEPGTKLELYVARPSSAEVVGVSATAIPKEEEEEEEKVEAKVEETQKKKKRVRKPRAPAKRKLAVPEDGVVAGPILTKRGPTAKKKKGSEVVLQEKAFCELSAPSQTSPVVLSQPVFSQSATTIERNQQWLNHRMAERMAFCRRTQISWHIQQAVTRIVHDTCLGCKTNCITDHSTCNSTLAYIVSHYLEAVARILFEKGADGILNCDRLFLEELGRYDPKRSGPVRKPSSILRSYFMDLHLEADWVLDILGESDGDFFSSAATIKAMPRLSCWKC